MICIKYFYLISQNLQKSFDLIKIFDLRHLFLKIWFAKVDKTSKIFVYNLYKIPTLNLHFLKNKVPRSKIHIDSIRTNREYNFNDLN
jgi:hypothetical protein